MDTLKDKVAIVGVGATPQGTLPGSTALSLAVDAFKSALDDAGLRKEQIDGLLSFPGTTSPEGPLNYLRLGETLGIDPAYTATLTMGGNTVGALVHLAAASVARAKSKMRRSASSTRAAGSSTARTPRY